MKQIIFTRRTHPDSPFPYGDSVRVLENGAVLYDGPAGTNPNPFKIATRASWQDNFAQVAPGNYLATFQSNHPRFGRTLLMTTTSGVMQIKTTNSNVNHGGAYYAEGVFIHKGDSPVWRGSTGCMTIPPGDYPRFMSLWREGEKALVSIIEQYGALDIATKSSPLIIIALILGGYLLYSHYTKGDRVSWNRETDTPQISTEE